MLINEWNNSIYQLTCCLRERHVTQVYVSIEPHQLPIIYREEYNVHFGGIEKLHPFDAAKWGHVFQVCCILLNYNYDKFYLYRCVLKMHLCSYLLTRVTRCDQIISAPTCTSLFGHWAKEAKNDVLVTTEKYVIQGDDCLMGCSAV